MVHVRNRVEVAHDVRCTEGVARLHRLAMNLLDHDDDVPGALAALCLIDHGQFERQTGQPWPLFTRLFVPQMVGANKMLRRFV